MSEKITYLLMVTPDNHNKYYKMIPSIPEPGKFTAEYGRVGAKGMTKIYSMQVWNSLYHQKIQKGYVDQTHLHDNVVTILQDNGFAAIPNQLVNDLMARLQKYANDKISVSYKVTSQEVTSAMVSCAQHKLDELSDIKNISEFNQKLLQLFSIIPRKMGNVSDYLAFDASDFNKIINREQNTLDVMRSSVNQKMKIYNSNKKLSHGNPDKTILESLGLDIRPCNDMEIKEIKNLMQAESAPHFKQAFRVVNKETEEKFNTYIKKYHYKKSDVHLLFHGSRNANCMGILSSGLKLNPKAVVTGKMFGYGIYFATRAQKSINYSSLKLPYRTWVSDRSPTGFLLIFKVAYKKPLDVHFHQDKYFSYKYSDIQADRCDALFAHKGTLYDSGFHLRNDEIIVYQEEQATIQYIIELH